MLKSTTGPVPMRGVLSLAVDPGTILHPTPANGKDGAEGDAITFYTASSDPCIRRWYLSHDLRSAGQVVAPDDGEALVVHETSVNGLYLVSGMEEEDREMWTASSDGWVKCLVPRTSTTTAPTSEVETMGWDVATSLHHGDYVRAVCVDHVGGWIVTAGRDEDVKVWDRGTGALEVVLRGHFEEVTGLIVMGNGRRVVSVGIDRTVRVWELDEEGLGRAKKVWEERGEEGEGEDGGEGMGEKPGGGLTEEEERELAELMDDDDDDR